MVLIFIINGEAVVRHWCESVESSLMKLLSAPQKNIPDEVQKENDASS